MEANDIILDLLDQTLWITAIIAAPVLLATLSVGIIIGILQAATSINEQTMTFVPKLLAVAVVLVLLGSTIMGLLSDFTHDIFFRVAEIKQWQ